MVRRRATPYTGEGVKKQVGRFLILDTLDTRVFRAKDPEDETEAAVKVPSRPVRVAHPNVVAVRETGEDAGEPYAVMDLVQGQVLPALKLEREALLVRLRQAADALDYAHAAGVRHGALTPSDLMCCDDGSVKLTLFEAGEDRIRTDPYAPPEQLQGKPGDTRSDQFSLAAITCEALSGRKPFDAPSGTALVYKVLWSEPEISTDLAQPLRTVLLRALAKDPEARFASCAEFVQALQAALSASATTADKAEGSSLGTVAPGNKGADGRGQEIEWSGPVLHGFSRIRPGSWRPVWITVAVLLALALAFWAATAK